MIIIFIVSYDAFKKTKKFNDACVTIVCNIIYNDLTMVSLKYIIFTFVFLNKLNVYNISSTSSMSNTFILLYYMSRNIQ